MKKVLIVVLVIILIIALAVGGTFLYFKNWYNNNLKAVGLGEEINIEIKSGARTIDIAQILEENKVIKNADAFKVYLKLNKINDLKAGKYVFNNGTDDVKAVVNKLVNYDVKDTSIKIMFVDGKTFKNFANTIADNTNNTVEDVYNLINDDYLNSLIEKYWFLTDEIKNSDIYYALEGYLKPETYAFDDKNVTVDEIITRLLDATDEYLSKYREKIETSGLTVHEILTLASIIEKEASNKTDMPEIAGVFYNRLNSNMSLGSDVTTYYAYQIDLSESDLTSEQLNSYNPYNTRGPNMNGKLPVGPICNPSEPAIEAAINPLNTDNYYFVADKNGKTYFSKNYNEHTKIVNELKQNDMWYNYE